MQKYTATYFINKFEEIPEENWTTGVFERAYKARCALGHCGYSGHTSSLEGIALIELFNIDKFSVVNVNDSKYGIFDDLGDTPKERILNALVLIDNNLLKEF